MPEFPGAHGIEDSGMPVLINPVSPSTGWTGVDTGKVTKRKCVPRLVHDLRLKVLKIAASISSILEVLESLGVEDKRKVVKDDFMVKVKICS